VDTGNVTRGVPKTIQAPHPEQVPGDAHRRQRVRRPPGRPGGGTAGRDNDIDLHADQFSGEYGQAFRLALSVSLFDDEVPPFDVAEVAQLLAERLDEGMTASREPADADLSVGLAPSTSRPRGHARCNTASEGTAIHLFNDLIGPGQHRRRDRQPEGLSRFEVHDELKGRGLFDREIEWAGPSQDLVYKHRNAPNEVLVIGAVGHQTA